MTVGIIGAGAIGTMIGAYADQEGFGVQFIGRKGPMNHHPTVSINDGPIVRIKSDNNPPEFFFLAVKSYQIVAALRQHQEICTGKTVIIIANGWYEDELSGEIRKLFDIRCGCTTIASRWDGNKFKVLNNNGYLVWESGAGAGDLEKKLLQHLGPYGFQASVGARQIQQKKWLFNTVINSLCGGLSLDRNIQILNHQRDLRDLFIDAYNFGTVIFGDFGASQEDLFSQVELLIKNTAGNKNSMYADIEKKQLTENCHLAGLIFKQSLDSGRFRTLRKYARLIEDYDLSVAL